MIPKSFGYLATSSVQETIDFLQDHNDAKILAGGMSLLPIMKLRLASPPIVVDINQVDGLDYIREDKDLLLIGALTRHHTLETSALVAKKIFLFAETASWIADPQVRNMGTIGGALAHGDPSGDWGAALLAVRGKIVAKSSKNERLIESDDFFLDTLTSALQPNELLTEIRIPLPAPGSGGAYAKLERKSGDFATVGVAVQISIDAKGRCFYAGIGLTALGPTNLRAKRAEAALLERRIDDQTIEEASKAASEDTKPEDDILRGSSEYKREMARVFTKRALKMALKRIRGGS